MATIGRLFHYFLLFNIVLFRLIYFSSYFDRPFSFDLILASQTHQVYFTVSTYKAIKHDNNHDQRAKYALNQSNSKCEYLTLSGRGKFHWLDIQRTNSLAKQMQANETLPTSAEKSIKYRLQTINHRSISEICIETWQLQCFLNVKRRESNTNWFKMKCFSFSFASYFSFDFSFLTILNFCHSFVA